MRSLPYLVTCALLGWFVVYPVVCAVEGAMKQLLSALGG